MTAEDFYLKTFEEVAQILSKNHIIFKKVDNNYNVEGVELVTGFNLTGGEALVTVGQFMIKD